MFQLKAKGSLDRSVCLPNLKRLIFYFWTSWVGTASKISPLNLIMGDFCLEGHLLAKCGAIIHTDCTQIGLYFGRSDLPKNRENRRILCEGLGPDPDRAGVGKLKRAVKNQEDREAFRIKGAQGNRISVLLRSIGSTFSSARFHFFVSKFLELYTKSQRNHIKLFSLAIWHPAW